MEAKRVDIYTPGNNQEGIGFAEKAVFIDQLGALEGDAKQVFCIRSCFSSHQQTAPEKTIKKYEHE